MNTGNILQPATKAVAQATQAHVYEVYAHQCGRVVTVSTEQQLEYKYMLVQSNTFTFILGQIRRLRTMHEDRIRAYVNESAQSDMFA